MKKNQFYPQEFFRHITFSKLKKIQLLLYLLLLTLSFYANAQSCNFPTPVITTNLNTACILYDSDFRIIPNTNNCFQVCENSIVTYAVLATSGHSYNWSVGGGGITANNSNSISVNWGLAGSGVVQITESDAGGCSYTVERCIIIIPTPIANFNTQPVNDTQSGNSLEICLNQTVNFFGEVAQNSVQSPIASWFWYFDDPGSGVNNTSTDHYPVHTFNTPGSFDVFLTVTNECGCSDAVLMTVNVTNDEAVQIECPTPVCEGDWADYSVGAICTAGGYNWSISPPNAGTITSPVPYGNSITVIWLDGSNGPGVVSFSGTNCNTQCKAVASIVVPIITSHAIIQGPLIVCSDNLQSAYTIPQMPGSNYLWSIAGGSILSGNGTNSVVVQWDACGFSPCNGVLYVDYSNDFFECPAGRSELEVEIKNPLEISGDQTVCPGSSPKYNSNATGALQWVVLDQNGNTVFGPTIQLQPYSINTATLPSGSYSLQVTDLNSIYCNPEVNFSFAISTPPPAPSSITGVQVICAGASYQYGSTPTNPNNFLTWGISNNAPASLLSGNNITVAWQNALNPVYGLSVKETDPVTGCFSDPVSLAISKKSYIPILPCSLQEVGVSGCVIKACLNTLKTYTIANFNQYNVDQMQWSISPSDIGSVTSFSLHPITNDLTLTVQWNNTVHANAEIKLESFTCGSSNLDALFTLDITGGGQICITNEPGFNSCTMLDACENLATVFNIYAPGVTFSPTNTTYEWDFGTTPPYSGNYSVTGVSHNYNINTSASLNFPVSVHVNDNGCLSYASTTIDIIPGPGANLQASATNDCNGNVTLNAIQAGSYLWSSGETTQSISVPAGVYTLSVTGANGCHDEAIAVINQCPNLCIGNLANVNISFGAITLGPGCNEVDIPVTISPATGWHGYIIEYGDNGYSSSTAPSQTFHHAYGIATTYQVCVTVQKIIGGDLYCYSECTSVTIPLMGSIATRIGCPTTPSGYNYDFKVFTSGNNLPVNTYAWTLDGTPISAPAGNTTDPVPVQPGMDHIVNVTMTDAANYTCSQSITLLNSKIPTPPTATFTTSTAPYCEKQSVVNFTYLGNIDEVHHALWTFGDNAKYAPIFPLPAIDINAKRVYNANFIGWQASLDVYDDFGCIYTSPQENITVNANGLNGNINPASATFCPGSSSNLQFGLAPSSTTPTGYQWHWNNGTGISTSTNYPLTVTQTGQYYVTAFHSPTGCFKDVPVFANVTVKNVSNPIIRGKTDYCAGEQIRFNGNVGTNGITYQWALSAGLSLASGSLTSTLINVSPPLPGNHSVTLTIIQNGCSLLTTHAFIVRNPPVSPSLSVQPQPPCDNNAIDISATNLTPPLLLTWSNGMVGNSITVYNAGIIEATYTDPSSGCTSARAVIVNRNPDLGWMITGCIDRCNSEQNHIVVPGNGNIVYQSWEWIVNQTTVLSGSGSSVTDLDLNNELAGGGSLPPGIYVVQLHVTGTFGCEVFSEPIYVTVRSCPCVITDFREISYECIGVDANNWHYQTFNFQITFNVTVCPTAIVQLIPLPPFRGSLQNFTINGNTITLEGILASHGHVQPCFTLIYTDPCNPANNCTYPICDISPHWCDNTICSSQLELYNLQCEGVNAAGNNVYSFDFNLINLGFNCNAMYSVTNGTISSGLQTPIGPGNVIGQTAYFTAASPNVTKFCLQVNLYDLVNDRYCMVNKCISSLPDCPLRQGLFDEFEITVKAEATLSIVPNPVTEFTRINYSMGQDNNGSLLLQDMKGTIISKKYLSVSSGFTEYDCTFLSPGIYLLQLNSQSVSITKKLVVIK